MRSTTGSMSRPRAPRGADGAVQRAVTEIGKASSAPSKRRTDVPTARRTLDLPAALWHGTNLSIWLLLRKRGPLPPLCASRTADGPRREPRVAAAAIAEALVADGQNSVPHADRPATYIPLANATHNERNVP
jgi:hypothetical protein